MYFAWYFYRCWVKISCKCLVFVEQKPGFIRNVCNRVVKMAQVTYIDITSDKLSHILHCGFQDFKERKGLIYFIEKAIDMVVWKANIVENCLQPNVTECKHHKLTVITNIYPVLEFVNRALSLFRHRENGSMPSDPLTRSGYTINVLFWFVTFCNP